MSATSLTDNHGDRGMLKVMGMVLASLCLLSLFLFSMARLIGVERADPNDPVVRNALIGRIEPIGKVRTSADDLPHGDGVQVASAGGATRSGEELVQGICAGCHISGAGGAPKLDDDAAWAERREQGLDALVASVVNGKGSMPARGGSDYSDEEIRKAVQHIAMFEEDDGGDAAQTADGDAAADAGADDGEAVAQEGDAPADERQVAMNETPAEDGGDGAAAGGGGDLVALIGSGEDPAGLTEKIKGSVDGVCAGCHIAGAAGAPMLGDVEAWSPRAELGIEALTQSVANGKGAMPPRGGSDLSDEEIPVAIRYLMAKQP